MPLVDQPAATSRNRKFVGVLGRYGHAFRYASGGGDGPQISTAHLASQKRDCPAIRGPVKPEDCVLPISQTPRCAVRRSPGTDAQHIDIIVLGGGSSPKRESLTIG